MGKTAEGAVWLDETMLSPFDYFQYFRNTHDGDVIKFLKLFTDLSLEEIKKFENLNNENILSNILSKPITCKKIFDDCYKKERFDEYNCWVTVGMALKNSFANEVAIDLFDYFSSKGNKYEGYEKTKYKFSKS